MMIVVTGGGVKQGTGTKGDSEVHKRVTLAHEICKILGIEVERQRTPAVR